MGQTMLYELIGSMNQRIILGEKVDEEEKQQVIDTILSEPDYTHLVSKEKYATATLSQAMYPALFSLQEKAGKLRLFTGELPKTNILLHNSYELEIARLLALWARGQDKVETILDLIEHRLNKTCFGFFCHKGEGPGASVAVLRFWAAYKPDDVERQKEIMAGYKPYRDGRGLWRKGLTVPHFYLFSAFSECACEAVEEELQYCSDLLWGLLHKAWLDEPYTLLRKHIVKKALSRVPGYEFVAETTFYIGGDGRWHTRTTEEGKMR